MNLPKHAVEILDALQSNGQEAYVVGGCVRDSLLGRAAHDWDICTSAKPYETIASLPQFHIVETGIQHGTVTVIIDSTEAYEITTFRQDGTYSDHRRPDQVEFVSSLKEDLKRRDFTVNAMAYHPAKGLIDLFGGQADLEQKLIRCVGNPDERFSEDALRILRALRFAAVYGFSLEPNTAQAAVRSRHLLRSIAGERIREELCKLICGRNCGVMLNHFTSIFTVFLGELEPFIFQSKTAQSPSNLWKTTIQSVENAPIEPNLRLALLFHDIGKPFCFTQQTNGVLRYYGHAQKSASLARTILRRLRFDNASINEITQLIRLHETAVISTQSGIRRQLSRLGAERLRQLFVIKRAIIKTQPFDFQTARLANLDRAEQLLNQILERNLCYQISDLAINGRDLLGAGYPPNAAIGTTLQTLLRLVIDGALENRRDCLLAYCRKEGINSHEHLQAKCHADCNRN